MLRDALKPDVESFMFDSLVYRGSETGFCCGKVLNDPRFLLHCVHFSDIEHMEYVVSFSIC